MLPSWRDWMFSVKTFAGAMLALWIALRIGLDRPYWAMATAYIVAQPLTGAMRSKAATASRDLAWGGRLHRARPQSGQCTRAADRRAVPLDRRMHLFRRPGPDATQLCLPAGRL